MKWMCNCGYTDWCPGTKDGCADRNPDLFNEPPRKIEKQDLREVAAGLLAKYPKKSK